MSTQWWPAHFVPPTGSAQSFAPIGWGLNGDSTDANKRCPVGVGGNMLTIRVDLTVAPGSGKSYRFQVSINGTANTTLDVTISNTATSGSATGTIALSAGDRVSIRCTPSGTPTATVANVAVEFDPTTANYFTYMTTPSDGNDFTGPNWTPAFWPLLFTRADYITTEDKRSQSVIPFAGTFRTFYAATDQQPGVGKSWDLTLRVNGVDVGSVLTISGTNTTGNQTGLSISLNAGDLLTFRVKASSGGPPSSKFFIGVVIEPTTAGLFAWSANYQTTPDQSVANYEALVGFNDSPSSTESTHQFPCPANLTAKALYVALTAAPSSGKSWAFRSRVAGANGNLLANISNAATTGSDSTNSDSLSQGQLLNLSSTPSGSPTSTGTWAWSIALSGTVAISGSGSVSFPHLTAQGTGSENFTATAGSAAFPHLIAQGTGNEAPIGIAAVSFPHLTIQGSGDFTPPTGTGNVTLAHLTAQGSGAEIPQGAGAVTFPNFEASSPDARAHGGHIGGQHFIGHSKDIVFPHFKAQGTGTRAAPTNTGAILFPHFMAQGTGTRYPNGIGIIAFPALKTEGGIGDQNPAGMGAITFPHFQAQGFTVIGVGSIAFPAFRAQGYADSPIGVGLGAFTLPAFRVQGRSVFISPVIILTKTGPQLASVFVHSPWYPRHRLACLTTANNIDRSFTAVSRLGTKDTGQGGLHISNKDPALLRDSGIIQHGNLIVITSPVAAPWIGVLVTTQEDDVSGQIELSAISYEAVLDGRITPQTQKFTKTFGANAVFDSLISEANARNHLGIVPPAITEITNPVEDLEVGGQSVLEALNELSGRTDSEWWLDYEVSPRFIKTILRLGFMQGFDLSGRKHFYQGTHFTAQYKADMSQVKQSVTTVGDFGADLPDRNSVTRVASFGPQHSGIATAAIHEAGIAAQRRLAALPAGLRNEKVNFEVMTGSTAELSRRSQVVQERPLQAERTFNATFYSNVDWRDVQAGNIVSLWGNWGGVSGQHIVRVMGCQPDEEQGQCVVAGWELVQ